MCRWKTCWSVRIDPGAKSTILAVEANADQIRRAMRCNPSRPCKANIRSVRNIEDDILPTLEELGIGLVPYSPLGRLPDRQVTKTPPSTAPIFGLVIRALHPRRSKPTGVIDLLEKIGPRRRHPLRSPGLAADSKPGSSHPWLAQAERLDENIGSVSVK